LDYICVGLSARPHIGAGNRLWHRLYHGVLDETFDVLLNKDSKRKISSTVIWKKGEQLFGQDAFNTVRNLSVFRAQVSDSDSCVQGSRFPSDTFTYLKTLLGVPSDAPVVTYYAQIASARLHHTPRRTRRQRKSHRYCCCRPPQFKHDAIADAIEITGLRTLAIINDGTAVAVNYAMTRTFPTPEYHIIYDAGSSGIRATVVSFTIAKDSKTCAAGTHIAVGGVGYDRTTDDIELDKCMREILIDAFEDVREDKRGMAKLWKEALRVKAILSANNEAMATVENLAWGIDFKTRTEFAKPIEDALKNAGLTLDNVTSAIVMGGSTRIPMVQTAVKAAVGGYTPFKISLLLSLTTLLSDKIALNVNADEAAVLWAALYGASLSPRSTILAYTTPRYPTLPPPSLPTRDPGVSPP